LKNTIPSLILKELEFKDQVKSQKLILKKQAPKPVPIPAESWKILIADDDRDVHESTVLALKGEIVLGRRLQFLHAYSARECLEILEKEGQVAVVLMDAVMEAVESPGSMGSRDSGLNAVKAIREEKRMHMVRIILRTGQPGDAPELETIHLYDINDYKTKSELTRIKLLTTIITAVRSYCQLAEIEESKRRLEKVNHANRSFRPDLSLTDFGTVVLQQTSYLFHLSPDGFLCRVRKNDQTSNIKIIASSGSFGKNPAYQSGKSLDDPEIETYLRATLKKEAIHYWGHMVCLLFSDSQDWDYIVYLNTLSPSEDLNSILEVYSSNLSLAAENLRLYSKMERLAYEDVTLGIPNLSALIREMEKVKSRTGKNLYLIDIHQFGIINDLLGHEYGDLVLESFVQHSLRSFPEGDFMARVTGDVFGVISSVDDLKLIQEYYQNPIPIGEGFQQISVCIGALSIDDPSLTGSDFLKNAHIALKRAKSEGAGKSVRYNPVIGLETRERIRMLQDLRAAFNHEKMFLMYQPQVFLDTGEALGFEALLRWKNNEGKFIPPSQFIPLAEQAGLIVPMGSWILRMALFSLLDLQNQGYDQLQMAINVSALQLRNPHFLTMLKEALRDTGVNPHCVELEITESVAVLGVERVVSLFGDIKSLGVSIAIDDFGTGYSSLSSIDRWPADRLKIDRSFVSGIEQNFTGGRIVDLVIPLGKKLGMKVLAEGIETQEQAAHLKRLGCLEGQGFLYAKPMTYEDAVLWLNKR